MDVRIKNMTMKKSLIAISILWIFISCGSKKVTPEIFLIPTGYRGGIHIVMNESCGRAPSMEEKKRVYIIPENGILISSFKMESGIIDCEFYYIDAKGNRALIPKMMMSDFNEETTTKRNENEPPRDQVGIFQWGNTGNAQYENEKEFVFYSFYVGTYTEVRDSFSTMFQGDGKYEHMFDSLTYAQLKLCRTLNYK
jgi:hypothetical protein